MMIKILIPAIVKLDKISGTWMSLKQLEEAIGIESGKIMEKFFCLNPIESEDMKVVVGKSYLFIDRFGNILEEDGLIIKNNKIYIENRKGLRYEIDSNDIAISGNTARIRNWDKILVPAKWGSMVIQACK